MSLQFNTIETDSRFGVRLHHAYVRQEGGSDRLLILLPGGGYTGDYPLLYYLRKAGLQLGYDVLTVQYGFQAAGLDLTAENMPLIQQDAEAAVQPALAHGYQQVCFAGKSLGTPLAAGFARDLTGARASLILLTPIGGATGGLKDIPTLAVAGTADPTYVPELVTNEPHIQWLVCEGLNHSLEVRDDWRGSLAVLPDIIAACETFLQRD